VPRFRAELKVEGKTATYVVVPLDVPSVFGRDDYFVPIKRELREAAGAAAGDTVEMELELDTKPRIVRLPKDFAAALDDEARASFDRMSYSHRKEYVDWIKEAKREDTRSRRIAKAVELIRQGKPHR
jgi:uncharacterized protein YdeI (YjbR/CyaY-like superfamily)